MEETGPRHYTRWPVVEGYAGEQSFAPGDEVDVHCASRADRFSAEVHRIGADRELVWRRHGIVGIDHPVPEAAWRDGCDWPVTFTVPTGPDWPSGYYEISLLAEGHGEAARSEAFFVLRRAEAAEPAGALLVLATNTWQAYNQWGGRCMYSGATRVSFRRPLERGYLRRPSAPEEVEFDGRLANTERPSDPTHARLLRYQAEQQYPLWTESTGWHNWERRFVAWAERRGYRLDYAVNADLERRPEAVDGHRLLLSVGHDEYWSWGMRDTVDAFVEAGGNLAVFSGNTCNWQVRYDDDGASMICHKGRARRDDPVRDGPMPERLTSMWSDPRIGRPETETIGLSFSRGGYHRVGLGVPDGDGSYRVHRPEHWALAGTGLAEGDTFGGEHFVVAYEVDGCALTDVDGRPEPTHEDGAPETLQVIATAPARLLSITDEVCEAPAGLWASLDPPGDLEGIAWLLFGSASPEHVARLAATRAVMASFTKGGGEVVNAGTTDWSYALADPVVDRITRNVLDRLGRRGSRFADDSGEE